MLRAVLERDGKIFVDDLADLTPFDSRGSAPRHNRRLSDKLLIAFHQACDQHDDLVASQLLRILESMLTRRPRKVEFNRRSMETLVAAHERLWRIRHQEHPIQYDLVAQGSTDHVEIHV